MKLSEIMRNNTVPDDRMESTLIFVKENGKHTGDIDDKKVYVVAYNDSMIYGIENDGNITSFVMVSKTPEYEKYSTIKVSYTQPKYRGQKDLQRLIWFIKDDDQISLISSAVQSDDAHNLMKAIDRSGKFDMKWVNIKTGELEPYNNADDAFPSQFRDNSPNDWRIIIEGAEKPLFESRFMHMPGKFWHLFARPDVSYAKQGLSKRDGDN